jgi:hypothetical protein
MQNLRNVEGLKPVATSFVELVLELHPVET